MSNEQHSEYANNQYAGHQFGQVQQPPAPYPGAPYPPNAIGQVPPTNPPAKSRNTVGLVAVILAVVGFLFGCIPGALIVGWILLPAAFILGIVGLCQSGKDKWTSIAAVIVSVIGTIVTAVVFATVVVDAVDDAVQDLGGGDVTVSQDGQTKSDDVGSRENPATIGSTMTSSEWKVVVNDFDSDATDRVMAANQFNDEPGSDQTWALVNLTVTYTGKSSGFADFIGVAFVTDAGKTYTSYEPSAVEPDPTLEGELYSGGTTTGNVAVLIPKDAQGLLRISMGALGDDVFVSVS